jgi:hypothetical protein
MPSEKSSNSLVVLVCFVIVLVVLGAVWGVLYYLHSNEQPANEKTVSRVLPTIIITPTPTLTPTPVVLERKGFRIAVLNGSGTVGAARNISTHLTSLGYTTTIGNAFGFAYRDITIKIKKDKENYLQQLQTDVAGQAGVSSISASVDNTIPVDAQVIVGR